MNRIKLLAVGLMLALASFVYAAGSAQETKKACGMEKAECCASCCKDEDSCCKMDKTSPKQTAAQSTQESKAHACTSCECCKDEKSCCKACKSGKAHACDMSKDGAGCCSSDGCGEACCKKMKAQTS